MTLPPLDTAVLKAPTLSAFWAALAQQRPQWVSQDVAELVADTPLGDTPLSDVTLGGEGDPILIQANLDPVANTELGLNATTKILTQIMETPMTKPKVKDAIVDVRVGLTLLINEKPVALSNKASEKKGKSRKQTGMKLELPERVDLGPVKNLEKFLVDHMPDNTASGVSYHLPEPLNSVEEKLGECHLAVERLSLTIPPSKDDKNEDLKVVDPITFALGVSAQWEHPIQLIDQKIAVKGISFDIERSVKPEPVRST